MNLPRCTPGNLSACQDKEVRKQYESYMSMSLEEIDAAITLKEKEIEEAEEDFRSQFKQMQTRYDEMANKYEFESIATKQQIKLLKEILAQKQ